MLKEEGGGARPRRLPPPLGVSPPGYLSAATGGMGSMIEEEEPCRTDAPSATLPPALTALQAAGRGGATVSKTTCYCDTRWADVAGQAPLT